MIITGDTVINKHYHPAQNSTVADKTSVCTLLINSRRMLGDTQIFCEKDIPQHLNQSTLILIPVHKILVDIFCVILSSGLLNI